MIGDILATIATSAKTRTVVWVAKSGKSGLLAFGKKFAGRSDWREERGSGGMADNMKAWFVMEKDGDCATVVFAETRGKARALAMATDACEDADFCDIEVRRKPSLDKYYKEGKKEMDWYDGADRLALVEECGFYCVDIDIGDCEDCPAKEHCDNYKDQLEYLEDCEDILEEQT